MSNLRIVRNPDGRKAKEISDAVKANGGYCPCRIDKTEDNKCMCKEFREQDKFGFCHCGLYAKIGDGMTELDLVPND